MRTQEETKKKITDLKSRLFENPTTIDQNFNNETIELLTVALEWVIEESDFLWDY